MLRQALKAGVRHIDEQVGTGQPGLYFWVVGPTKLHSPQRVGKPRAHSVNQGTRPDEIPCRFSRLSLCLHHDPPTRALIHGTPCSSPCPPCHPVPVQVCSILLDLCAVKGRMGLAEEIASLMEIHRIPKGDQSSTTTPLRTGCFVPTPGNLDGRYCFLLSSSLR